MGQVQVQEETVLLEVNNEKAQETEVEADLKTKEDLKQEIKVKQVEINSLELAIESNTSKNLYSTLQKIRVKKAELQKIEEEYYSLVEQEGEAEVSLEEQKVDLEIKI